MNQLLQRGVLIVVVVMVIFFVGTEKQKKDKEIQAHWEQLHAEEFLEGLCRTGKMSYEEFLMFYKALNYYGVVSDIRISEYQKEQDLEGNLYRYLIPWEELSVKLVEEGCYLFRKGSIIELAIMQKEGSQEERKYYDVVWEEWGNDT